MLAVAEDAEVAGDAAVGLEHDAGQDLLALLQTEALDVEVRHADPPAVVVGVLAIVGGDALGEALQQLAHGGGVDHRQLPLDQLDPVAVGVAHEAEPAAAVADPCTAGFSGSIPCSASRARVASRSAVVIAMWP